jgi:hypothetical protein
VDLPGVLLQHVLALELAATWGGGGRALVVVLERIAQAGQLVAVRGLDGAHGVADLPAPLRVVRIVGVQIAQGISVSEISFVGRILLDARIATQVGRDV